MLINNDATQSDNPAVKEAREKARHSFIELSRNILDILPTLEDSLNIMCGQLQELKLEASIMLFQEFGAALQSIDTALPTIFFENEDNEDSDKVNAYLACVFENIISLADKYEAGDITAIKTYLTDELLPSFKLFRQKLEAVLLKAFPPA